MKYKIAAGIVGIVILAFAVWFIKNKSVLIYQNAANDGKVHVSTSFYPLYFFAAQIGGDRAHVVNITPAGGEPHDYEPTPRDIIQIANSKLLVLNGGGLESWGDKVKQILDPLQTLVVVAGSDSINQTVAEEGNTIVDPHVWLSPPLAKIMVGRIADGLKQVDTTNASYYESNAQALESKIDNLDNAYKKGLASCAQTDIITSHAAFGYLATAYHLHQVPIAGLSPDAEPSPRQLGDIVQLARKNNIKYIFFESLASPKLSETIAREVGAQTLVLNPIEGLTPDQVAQGKDYFTEMMNNLANLQLALNCQK